MSNLTIADLVSISRKPSLTKKQRELMHEKMALMRAKSIEKRNAKKAEAKESKINKLMELQYKDIKKQTLLKYLVQIEFMEAVSYF